MFTFDTQLSAKKRSRTQASERFCSRKIKGKLLDIQNPLNLSILVIYENYIELQGYQQPSGELNCLDSSTIMSLVSDSAWKQWDKSGRQEL